MADGEVVIDTSLDPSGFEKGLGKLGSIAGTGIKATTGAIMAVGTALEACAGYAIKVGSDFEAGMSKVEAISGASEKQVKTATGAMVDGFTALNEKAKEMGATTKFSATESAEALNYMAMAGWEPQQMYDGLAGVMNLAAASGEDLATTSDIVTDALTAFKMEAGDSGHFADILAQASSSANTDVSMMGDTFRYVAPLCGTLGYSAEDAAVAIGLMANSGIKGTQAGTSLKTAIANMAAPTKAMANQMKALGIEMTNSDGTSKSLMEVMQNLRTGFADLSETEKTAAASTIFGKEAMSGMLAIINSSDEDFAKLVEQIDNADGAAERMAATMQDNLQGQLTILKSGVEGLGIAVYEKLQEPLKNLAIKGQEYIQQLTTAFNEGGFSGLVSEIGSVLADVITQVAEYTPKVIEAATGVISSFLEGLRSAIPTLVPAVVEIGTTLVEGIMSTVVEFVSVGIELVNALINGVAEAAPELIVSFTTNVLALVSTIAEQLPAFLEAGMNLIQGICDGIIQALPVIIETAPTIIQNLCTSLSTQLPSLLATGMEIISSLGNALITYGPQLASAAVSIIQQLATFIVANLPKIAQAAIQIITQLATALIAHIPDLLASVVKIMQGLLGFVVDNLGEIAQAAVEIITQLCTQLVSLIPELIPVVTNIIMSFFNFVVQNLPTIVQGAIQIMLTLVNGIIAQIPTLIPAVIQIITQIFSSIVANLPTIISGAIQIITTLAMGLIQAIPHVVAAIPQIVVAIIQGFLNTDWASVGVNIIQGIGQGIANAAAGLVQIAVNAARNAIYAVKSWLGIHSPSRRAKEEIGKFILPGIGEGVEESEPDLNEKMESAADDMMASFDDHARDIDVSGLVGRMKAGVDREVGNITTDVTVRTRSGSGQVAQTADEGMDYERMGDAVVEAFVRSDIKVECDDREVGRLIDEHTKD